MQEHPVRQGLRPGRQSLLLLSILGIALVMPAQNQKAKLQERKARIEQEIQNTNKLLNQTQQNKEANLNQLYLINKKINQREDLIQAIGEEVHGLEGQISTLNDTIYRLSVSLSKMKEEYARLIYSTYKNRNAYSRLMFIFASRNFTQAYKRLRYLQQYGEYRKTQANAILSTQAVLGNKKVELERQKSSKLTLREKQERERSHLATEKSQKDNAIKRLTKQEKNLLKKLKENEAALGKLQRAIEALIAEEIRKANEEKARKAALAAKSPEQGSAGKASRGSEAEKGISPAKAVAPAKSNSMSSSAEEIALSNTFSANKGRLPWPVEQGTISGSFGEHAHPEYKNIKVRNNGVDITTSAGTKARAVFDGVVSSVMSITNLHYVVIIRHGDYLTVYSNLKDVNVKKGDKIKTRQSIGTIYTDPEVEKTVLHFELWHGTALQNPQNWIGR